MYITYMEYNESNIPLELLMNEPICVICKYANDCPIKYNRLSKECRLLYNGIIKQRPVEK